MLFMALFKGADEPIVDWFSDFGWTNSGLLSFSPEMRHPDSGINAIVGGLCVLCPLSLANILFENSSALFEALSELSF